MIGLFPGLVQKLGCATQKMSGHFGNIFFCGCCNRSSGRNRQLQSDLDLPEQLQDFWYPVAFSSQMKDGAMVTMELFGQPWVLFRDAQGLPSCVKDACAHRACPLSLVSSTFM